jgi:hypothetical protein
MQHVVFNLIDSDHHTELWEFEMADGKRMGEVLDLKRTKRNFSDATHHDESEAM